MKIINLTHWNTKNISKLIYRVAQDELQTGQLKHAHIKIKYARTNGRLGSCYYGTPVKPRVWMTLCLPRSGQQVDSVQLAKVIAHELAHARGLRHTDMRNDRYGWVEGWRARYAYAVEYQIGMQPKSPRNVRPTPDTKLQHARKMLRASLTREKRAITLRKKWGARVKYYSKIRTTQPPASRSDLPVRSISEARSHAGSIPSPAL